MLAPRPRCAPLFDPPEQANTRQHTLAAAQHMTLDFTPAPVSQRPSYTHVLPSGHPACLGVLSARGNGSAKGAVKRQEYEYDVFGYWLLAGAGHVDLDVDEPVNVDEPVFVDALVIGNETVGVIAQTLESHPTRTNAAFKYRPS
jgi:hypothetical protein